MKKYPALQVLRAIAAWLVVYHHFMQIYFNYESSTLIGEFFSTVGHFGVHIFFVLSGFVMYLCTHKQNLTGSGFFFDRCIRIIPVYWFYTFLLLFCFLLAPNFFPSTAWDLMSLLASLMFIPSENPSGLGAFPFLTVGWTLNFEMFFYVSLALCLMLSKKYAVVMCGFVLIAFPLFWSKTWVFGSVLGSLLLYEFVAGTLLCYLWVKYDGNAIPGKKILGIVILIASSLGATLYPSVKPVWFGAAIGMVLSFLCLNDFFSGQSPGLKLFRFLGDVSYSTYLNHSIVISLGYHLLYSPSGFLSVVSLVACLSVVIFVISVFSHKYIETGPIVRYLKARLVHREVNSMGPRNVSE